MLCVWPLAGDPRGEPLEFELESFPLPPCEIQIRFSAAILDEASIQSILCTCNTDFLQNNNK